ncbi:hypothetical protein MOQ72_33025 [Saccharopolyspora sp. K220]|uniref:DUF4286 family protein n=1 Tax=Saccharopolyspora soli TaxID=2926618 RepID=UPI001F5A60E1|nr:DUF4286 family protein [Saccharopolyspora soli]MCI2422266.1 hypothetical protein [Saccharopolyspora soli]
MAEGMLFVLSEPAPGQESAFHDWYDTEHAPARMGIPGIRTARRYRAADGQAPGWLATYDLDLEALETEQYRRLRAERSERERAILATLSTLDRRSYELLTDHGQRTPEPAPTIVAVAITVPTDYETELTRWYEQEHIPLLLATPGWNRIRRYRRTTGAGPVFLALHELTGPEAFATEEYRTATNTPWRSEIFQHTTEMERRTFTFHKEFHQRATT